MTAMEVVESRLAKSTVRVLLADDHALIRAGLRAVLDTLEGIEVAGEATDGCEALALVGKQSPDIVLLDIAMPRLNGLETLSRLARQFPAVKVIMLSVHESEEYVSRSLRLGAAGYLLKDASCNELELAIRAVFAGETYLAPKVSKRIVADYTRRVGGPAGPLELLTPRQREILQLIAEGQTTKQIAETLRLSVKTIENHRAQLMERLDIHEVAGLVRYAMKMGFVT